MPGAQDRPRCRNNPAARCIPMGTGRLMRQKHSSAEAQLGLPEYRGHTLAERVAFALLVLFVVGAMAGLFGDGPLSEAVVASDDGQMRVEYQRFCRRQAQQSLDVTFPTQPGADSVELTLNGDYLRRVQITEIFPQPLESSHHQAGKLRFTTDGSGQAMTVRMHLEPQHAGMLEAHLTAALPGKPAEVHFKQIVYP